MGKRILFLVKTTNRQSKFADLINYTTNHELGMLAAPTPDHFIPVLYSLGLVGLFYVYFKDVNQQLYDASFNSYQLKSVLKAWGNWHWLRVVFEFLSLTFLILALNIATQTKGLSKPNQTM